MIPQPKAGTAVGGSRYSMRDRIQYESQSVTEEALADARIREEQYVYRMYESVTSQHKGSALRDTLHEVREARQEKTREHFSRPETANFNNSLAEIELNGELPPIKMNASEIKGQE